MKGFGTVVTGTLMAGTICREDELEVFPTGRRVRVRGLQVHGETAEAATAGQRTAVNLAGASTEDLSRGMTLALLGAFENTRRVDVKLRLLPSAPHPLKERARVHLHSSTMETVAEVALLRDGHQKDIEQKQVNPRHVNLRHVNPGEEVFARLKLREATLLLPGDRFIIRQFSPVVTIGGGVVLDAATMQSAPANAGFLNVLAGGDAESILKARITRRLEKGITIKKLVAETGMRREIIETVLAPALRQGQVLQIGDRLLFAGAILALQKVLLQNIEGYCKKNPLAGGIAKEELRMQSGALADVFDAMLDTLARKKKIEVMGDLVRMEGEGVVMKDEEAEAKKAIENAFATAGLQVPALQQVIDGLKIDRLRAQKIVTLLLRDKLLIKVSDELVFHRSALEALRGHIAAYKAKSAKIDVAAFKEMTGVTRKYAIPLLEYLDRERVTRRVGDVREIL